MLGAAAFERHLDPPRGRQPLSRVATPKLKKRNSRNPGFVLLDEFLAFLFQRCINGNGNARACLRRVFMYMTAAELLASLVCHFEPVLKPGRQNQRKGSELLSSTSSPKSHTSKASNRTCRLRIFWRSNALFHPLWYAACAPRVLYGLTATRSTRTVCSKPKRSYSLYAQIRKRFLCFQFDNYL